MSLGVYQAWRVLRQPDVARRLSAIPRGSSVSNGTRSVSSTSTPAPTPISQASNATSQRPADEPPVLPLRHVRVQNSEFYARNESHNAFYIRLAKLPIRRVNPKDSVLIKPMTVYPSRRQTRHQRHKLHRTVHNQEILEERLAGRGQTAPDWRVTLQLLDMSSQDVSEQTPSTYKIVPPAAPYRLTGEGADTIQRIAEDAGCHAELVKGEEWEAATSHMKLSGDPTAARNAIERILKHDARVMVVAVSSDIETVLHSGVERLMHWPQHALVDINRSHPDFPSQPRRDGARVNEVQLPETWTKETVEQYVAILTCDRLPRGVLRGQYKGKNHYLDVAQHLLALFSKGQAAAVASRDAFTMALVYLNARSPSFIFFSWRIFQIMLKRGIKPDIQAMNTMLQGAVQAKDLPRVHKYLEYMAFLKLEATPRTWILILRLIQNEEVRRFILLMMNRKGLFRMPGVVIEVASSMASHDVYRAIQLGQTTEAFIANQNTLYGGRWLNHYSANKVLQGFGCYGRFDDMLNIINLMFASETAKPTNVTLSTVMTHCRLLGNIRWAFKFLKLFERHSSKLPDPISLGELFKLLYSRRRPFMLSTAWRYARLHQLTTYRMRERVAGLLRGSPYLYQNTRVRHQEMKIKQKREQIRATQMFRHIQGGLSGDEKRALLRGLFPWYSKMPGAPEERDAIGEALAGPGGPRVEHPGLESVLYDADRLDEMVQERTLPLSRLLIRAERRDNQLRGAKQGTAETKGRRWFDRGNPTPARARRVGKKGAVRGRTALMPKSEDKARLRGMILKAKTVMRESQRVILEARQLIPEDQKAVV